jgi:hypothetical protein
MVREDAMRLRAHWNVVSLADARREREQRRAAGVQFVDWSATPAARPSHPAAQALLAGIMQGMGELRKNEALLDAGKRLAEAARRNRDRK